MCFCIYLSRRAEFHQNIIWRLMHRCLPAKLPECDDIFRHRSNPLTTPSPLHASANFLGRLIVQRINEDVCQCVRSYWISCILCYWHQRYTARTRCVPASGDNTSIRTRASVGSMNDHVTSSTLPCIYCRTSGGTVYLCSTRFTTPDIVLCTYISVEDE